MGLGIRRPELKKRPVFTPMVQGKQPATFGGYVTLEEVEEELRQADLLSIQQALEEHLQSGNEELQIELGVALDLSCQNVEALKVLTVAEQQLPENALAPYALARCLMETNPAAAENAVKQEGRWSVIVSHLREAIQLDPDNIPAHYHLGNAIRKLVEEESYVDAVEVYTRYLAAGAPLGFAEEVQNFINEQDPDKQREAAFARGIEMLEQHEYDKSITAFTTAAELGEIEAFYHLGKVYAITGAYGKAADAYQQAIAAGLDNEEVKEAYGQAMISMFCDLTPLSLGLQRLDPQNQDKRTFSIGREIFTSIQKILPHQGEISTAVFSPDGKMLISGASDGYVKFWDTSQGTVIDNLLVEPLPPIVKLCYSNDTQFIAVATVIERAAGNQYKIDVYNLATKALVNSYTNEAVDYLDFLFVDNEITLSEYNDRGGAFLLKQWDFKNNQVTEKERVPFSLDTRIVKFSADDNGQFLLTAMFVQSAITSPNLVKIPFKLVHLKKGDALNGISENLAAEEMITFSEDQKMAIITNESQSPKLFNLTNGAVQELKEIKGIIDAVCFSLDNKFILTIIDNPPGNVITCWDIEKEPIQQWQATTSSISSMAFSPDGMFIVLGLIDASLILLDIKEGNQKQRFPFDGFPGWQPLNRKRSRIL